MLDVSWSETENIQSFIKYTMLTLFLISLLSINPVLYFCFSEISLWMGIGFCQMLILNWYDHIFFRFILLTRGIILLDFKIIHWFHEINLTWSCHTILFIYWIIEFAKNSCCHLIEGYWVCDFLFSYLCLILVSG